MTKNPLTPDVEMAMLTFDSDHASAELRAHALNLLEASAARILDAPVGDWDFRGADNEWRTNVHGKGYLPGCEFTAFALDSDEGVSFDAATIDARGEVYTPARWTRVCR
jgi:hypothetical protein